MKRKLDIEIEYKFWVKDKKNLIKALGKKTRQYQNSVMFDNLSSVMQRTNGRIRVRKLGDTDYKTLTYKKPLSPQNGAKREIEYEITFRDKNGQIEKILEAMGFRPTTSYERYQISWETNDVRVTLDEYPFADIIEFEGEKDKIKNLAQKLGFDIKESITKPVDTLFQEWREERGLAFKPNIKFDDFDK